MDDAQRERLTCLMEECAEVIQTCSKALRFGIDDINPHNNKTNRELLEEELGDLKYWIEHLSFTSNDIDPYNVQVAMEAKDSKVKNYLIHN